MNVKRSVAHDNAATVRMQTVDMAFDIVEHVCGKAVADETAQYIEYERRSEAPACREGSRQDAR